MFDALRNSSLRAVLGFATLALFSASASSDAAITVYTSLAAFNAATSVQGTDTYTGFSITSSTPSPITRSAGPYSYTAAVTTTSFFGGGTTANPFLSTNTATDTITFNAFSTGVQGVGGNFFGSDISGSFLAGGVIVTATDGSGTSTQTISPASATAGSFLGFVSTGPMTSMTLTSVQPAGAFLWPSVDNYVLARGPVPEPASLTALCAAGTMLLRRRR